MKNEGYLVRLLSMSNSEIEKLSELIKRLFNNEYTNDNFPYELVEEINRILTGANIPPSSYWKKIGRFYFLKHGNSFDVIEVMRFGENFLGAVYSFCIQPSDNMLDYVKIADDSELDFINDTYKLAYGIACAMQLEDAVAIKISDNLNELYIWTRQWMLLSKDI